ncbi:ZrgA family zinc uptake protein [Agarilytica rhodophyticola]|uniref:ZrgA family zinc uptake protein n=1 Tax=Agarilytica rhodophyticola TaxID=1737490 RepID=UPI000B341997|nr:DUF2796 domain-containing protein [Agarilytica rhodophyticola]
MKPQSFYLIILLFSCLLMVSEIARSNTQEPHTHGLATLTLALENNILEVHFETPAANLVGFEYAAKSEKEKKLVIQAETILSAPTQLFSFVGTACQPEKIEVDISSIIAGEHKEEAEHSEHEDHHHSHEHHDHATEHHEESSHSEISAHYRFACNDITKLTSVSVALFKKFHSIEKIDAMWVTEIKQGAVTLSSNKITISLI